MQPISLYLLTREQDPGIFALYERHLSGRQLVRQTNRREQESLRALVEDLLSDREGEGLSPEQLSGFYYSYTIRHISKEFDLVKFPRGRNCVLNIELKSADVGRTRIREQLLQNRYYLGHLSDTIFSYTYVSSLHRLYCLNAHGYLQQVPLEALRKLLRDPDFLLPREGNIDALFDAVYYLISPITTPEKFLNGEYFLTNQQHEFRRQILTAIRTGKRPLMIGIGGGAGTGKTLLLYDLAMVLSRRHRVRILHCGSLSQGHRILDRKLRNVAICSGDGTPASEEDRESGDAPADYLLVDEAGRLPSEKFREIADLVEKEKLVCIFCYDAARFRFADADGRALLTCMQERANLSLSLSGNIRINRSLASFTRYLFDRREEPAERNFPPVLLRLAHGAKERELFCDLLRQQGFVLPGEGEPPAAGSETDRVAVVLGPDFFYDPDGVLHGGKGQEENLKALQLLYDEISRAREKLCLLVLDNDALFADLVRMISPAPAPRVVSAGDAGES